MKSRYWLPLTLALGIATGAYAQPPGYGPGAGPYGMGPGAMPMPMRPGMAPGARRMMAPQQPSAAAPRQSAAPEAAQAQNPLVQATETLQAGMDKLLDFLGQEESPNKLQVAAFLDREIAPYFDFDYMARWVAARSWDGMSKDQRHVMASRLEASFLTSLTRRLAEYQGQKARILRPRPGVRGTVKVPVAIVSPGRYPARMEFRMYRSADGWKVYDVLANGRSVTSYYRVRFQRMGMDGVDDRGGPATGS